MSLSLVFVLYMYVFAPGLVFVVSCRRVVSCRVVSCRVVSCRVMSGLVLSCLVSSCLAFASSCLALPCFEPGLFVLSLLLSCFFFVYPCAYHCLSLSFVVRVLIFFVVVFVLSATW
jgi:hypothetical protein